MPARATATGADGAGVRTTAAPMDAADRVALGATVTLLALVA